MDTLAYSVKEDDVQTLCYTLTKVDAKTLIYALTDRLPVVEEAKVGNTPAKVESKAVLDALAAREKAVNGHRLGDPLSKLKGIETLDTLCDTVAENELESLGDKQVEVNAKALDYQIPDTEKAREWQVNTFGDLLSVVEADAQPRD